MIACCRQAFVSQIRGPRTTSTDLLGCTMKKTQRLLISSYPIRHQMSPSSVRSMVRSGLSGCKASNWVMDELTRMTQMPSRHAYRALRRT